MNRKQKNKQKNNNKPGKSTSIRKKDENQTQYLRKMMDTILAAAVSIYSHYITFFFPIKYRTIYEQ